jgi:hypothetical protein
MSERTRPPGRQSLWPVVFIVIVPLATLGGLFLIGSLMHPFSFNLNLFPPDTTLPPPPPPSEYGTAREIGTRGDNPNPDALYHGAYPSDANTQERSIGGLPARFSGYTTWIHSVTVVPAPPYVAALPGSYLRVRVTVFNRDREVQHVCACDFFVWTRAGGLREADAVSRPVVATDTAMRSGARRDGNVYLYVGTVPGPYFIVYNPDAHVPGHASEATGVWRVPA